ncbi:MAG: ATP-binding protein [Planctomycetota bacterium]
MTSRLEKILGLLTPRLSSGRTALFLYVLLVVLPAVVFGGLLWEQLRSEQTVRLQEFPTRSSDAARRLSEACVERVFDKVELETSAPYYVYRPFFFIEDTELIVTQPSPLVENPRPASILGWFSFRASSDDSIASDVDVFRGSKASGDDPIGERIRTLVSDEVAPDFAAGSNPARSELERARNEGWGSVKPQRLRTIVLNTGDAPVEECRAALDGRPGIFDGEAHEIYVSHPEYRLFEVEDSARPWLVVYRVVIVPLIAHPGLPACFDGMQHDQLLVQGFVFDPTWLYTTMPRQESARVLDPLLQFVPNRFAQSQLRGLHFQSSNVLPLLPIVGNPDESITQKGTVFVAWDPSALMDSFRAQNARFAGVALVLTISMAIGIRLLLSSIRRSRTEAERTRNFVASVTHELRTPIAAVKLYGEMLSDGWISDEDRRGEYLRRIVVESDRLDGLVDRVLLRRRLSDHDHDPSAGDLNAEIAQLRPSLETVGGRDADDIEFELAEDLPKVLLLPDGVHVVLTNLVENARKYAPVLVCPDGTPGEKLLVRTRQSRKGTVLLEVLDRGPGIREEDRERIFEAFLRLGDESTRKTRGTGLGLHLVALQARAMRARVRALPRSEGGTVFQVLFARA